MKLDELGEFSFIDRITEGCLVGDRGRVVRGIGDDAAVVTVPDGVLLVTTDLLIERVHFLRGTIGPRQLGYKALAVNLSDIAAMGGRPLDAYLSIAVPADVPVEELDAIYAGFKELARSIGVNLLGGDTTGSKQDLHLSVVVIGSARPEQVLYRSGARVGDRLLVTGTLGDSAGGLRLLLTGVSVPEGVSAPLLRAHFEPELYMEEARIFAASGRVHAAIDLSDGLLADLGHICRQSGVGAVLDMSAIPLSDPLRDLCRVTGQDPLELALAGGEDYRLLVAADPDAVPMLRREVTGATGRALHDVGEIVAGISLQLRRPDGSIEPTDLTGWDNFRPPPPVGPDDPEAAP